MNRLLDALERGEDPLMACVVAFVDEETAGWATCEKFSTSRRTVTLLNVFVAESQRCKGIGTALARELLSDVEHRYPGTVFHGIMPNDGFWLRLTPMEIQR